MAVLVEAISVVVRRDAINARYPGGWDGFLGIVPNATLCCDDHLAQVGFMAPADVEAFIHQLERGGLVFERDGRAVDLAVVDQLQGPMFSAEWLEFAHVPAPGPPGKRLAACWRFEGPRRGYGIHMPSLQMEIALPAGWRYEGSLSDSPGVRRERGPGGHARVRAARRRPGCIPRPRHGQGEISRKSTLSFRSRHAAW